MRHRPINSIFWSSLSSQVRLRLRVLHDCLRFGRNTSFVAVFCRFVVNQMPQAQQFVRTEQMRSDELVEVALVNVEMDVLEHGIVESSHAGSFGHHACDEHVLQPEDGRQSLRVLKRFQQAVKRIAGHHVRRSGGKVGQDRLVECRLRNVPFGSTIPVREPLFGNLADDHILIGTRFGKVD